MPVGRNPAGYGLFLLPAWILPSSAPFYVRAFSWMARSRPVMKYCSTPRRNM